MAYNRSFGSNYGGGFANNRYQQRGNSYNNGYQQRTSAPKKRSGAKFTEKDGAPIVSAWKKNSKGFYSLYARPCKSTKTTTSDNGKTWINLFVTITNQTTMDSRNTSGLYDPQRKRLYIKEFNQIVSTGGQGGYWGKHISKR